MDQTICPLFVPKLSTIWPPKESYLLQVEAFLEMVEVDLETRCQQAEARKPRTWGESTYSQ